MGVEKLQFLKGIHPGAYLESELKKRRIAAGRFAMSIGEYPQTFSAIVKGRRGMNIPLSLKIEHALSLEEGFLMSLQVFYDIKMEKAKVTRGIKPDLSKLRKAIFWDTNIEEIDWIEQKDSVIARIFERGNEQEREEILRFYHSPAVTRLTNERNGLINNYALHG